MKKFKLTYRHIIYGLLLVGFLALMFQLDFDEVLYHLKMIRLPYLLLAMAAQILTMALLAFQWESMVKMAGFQSSFIQSFLMNAVGNVADAVNPGVKVGGELFRYDQLKKRFDMEAEESLLVVALQKIVSISAFYLLTLISLCYIIYSFGTDHSMLVPLITLMVIFALIIFMPAYLILRPEMINRIMDKARIKKKRREKISSFLSSYKETLEHFKKEPCLLLGQLLLAIFIWFFYAVKLNIVSNAFGVEINIFMVGAITYISYMIGMLPLLPGGLGSFEAGMLALFTLAGVDPELGLSISVVFRIMTFWFEFAFITFVLLIEGIIVRWKRLLKKKRETLMER